MKKVYISTTEDGFVDGWEIVFEEHEYANGFLLPDDHDFFIRPFSYKVTENMLVLDESKVLNTAKERKINALKEECSQRIIDGFEFMGYKFGFSTSDQSNITSTMMAMQMGLMNEIEWTVRTLEGETARVLLNEGNFTEMAKVALAHKENHIKHLRNKLEPKVIACTTLEELNQITWDGDEE